MGEMALDTREDEEPAGETVDTVAVVHEPDGDPFFDAEGPTVQGSLPQGDDFFDIPTDDGENPFDTGPDVVDLRS
jgi:hypothetical protein